MTRLRESELLGRPAIAGSVRLWAFAASFCIVAVTAEAQNAKGPDAEPRGGESLSERLDKSNGVIAPREGIDPGIQKPTPPVNAPTPVVPPPGSRSGGAIVPK